MKNAETNSLGQIVSNRGFLVGFSINLKIKESIYIIFVNIFTCL